MKIKSAYSKIVKITKREIGVRINNSLAVAEYVDVFTRQREVVNGTSLLIDV